MLGTTLLSRSIERELESVHGELREQLPAIDRVAAALYDRDTDTLKTFVHSSRGGDPLSHYEARLADVPSLAELARERRERIVNDLATLAASPSEHSQRIHGAGYGSSYTRPFFEDGDLRGFLFFDASETGYLTEPVVRQLAVYAHLVALILTSSLTQVRMLRTAVQVALQLSHQRDRETGAHLERMARYSRVVARHLDGPERLSDEMVELVFLFAPLHDIGKLSIPDSILFKQGPLTAGEFEVMKTHVERGVEIIEEIVRTSGLDRLPHVHVLRDLVRHHHEAFDGSGYPDRLAGLAIPVAARVTAVADVFDALTSHRPYKDPWPAARAFDYLRAQAGTRFDPDCVEALVAGESELAAIADRFASHPLALESREGYTPEL
jgi:HD-GYP domain-containing protein (c-di-GMP phosphodiesterase class II)